MRTVIFLAVSLATTSLFASWGDCANTAPRTAALPVAGATRITIVGRAGSLKVAGHNGAADDDDVRGPGQRERGGARRRIRAVTPRGGDRCRSERDGKKDHSSHGSSLRGARQKVCMM